MHSCMKLTVGCLSRERLAEPKCRHTYVVKRVVLPGGGQPACLQEGIDTWDSLNGSINLKIVM